MPCHYMNKPLLLLLLLLFLQLNNLVRYFLWFLLLLHVVVGSWCRCWQLRVAFLFTSFLLTCSILLCLAHCRTVCVYFFLYVQYLSIFFKNFLISLLAFAADFLYPSSDPCLDLVIWHGIVYVFLPSFRCGYLTWPMVAVGCCGNAQVTVSRRSSCVSMAMTDSWYSVQVRKLVLSVLK